MDRCNVRLGDSSAWDAATAASTRAAPQRPLPCVRALTQVPCCRSTRGRGSSAALFAAHAGPAARPPPAPPAIAAASKVAAPRAALRSRRDASTSTYAALGGRGYGGGSGQAVSVATVTPSAGLRPATSWEEEIEELDKLVSLLPPLVRSAVEDHPEMTQIVEVVMDLGRRPVARFPSGDVKLSAEAITDADLDFAISQVLHALRCKGFVQNMASAWAAWALHGWHV
eukprot:364218-Chlamydomonas_euryale.AAC.20